MSQPLARISPATDRDTIAAWLDMLVAILDLPDDQRRSVRAELESHLRERVRDLILSGDSEHQAAKTAIAELGDAASLARRYSRTIEPSHRRSLMQVAGLATVGTALVLTLGAVGGRLSQPEPKAEANRVQGAGIAPEGGVIEVQGMPQSGRRFSSPADPSLAILSNASITVTGDITWDAYVTELVKTLPIKRVRWDVLAQSGVQQQDVITLPKGTYTGLQIFEIAMERCSPLALREIDGGFELSTRDHVDRRECCLVVYDVSDAVADSGGDADGRREEIVSLITSEAYPDGWTANGGDMASIRSVGPKLFINAPARYHAKIEWLLAELGRPATATNEFRGRLMERRGVPVLSGVPLISNFFVSGLGVRGPGPGESYTFRPSADGKSVEVLDAAGNVIAAGEVRLVGSEHTVAGQALPGQAPGGGK